MIGNRLRCGILKLSVLHFLNIQIVKEIEGYSEESTGQGLGINPRIASGVRGHRQVVEFVCPKDVDIFTLDILRA